MASTAVAMAHFSYLLPLSLYEHEKPFKLLMDVPPGHRRTNLEFAPSPHGPDMVSDVRGTQGDFSVDMQGFQFASLETHMTKPDWASEERVKQIYFQEVKALVSRELGLGTSGRVEVWDWRLRVSMSESDFVQQKRRINLANPTESILPAMYPHVGTVCSNTANKKTRGVDSGTDQTPYSACKRLTHHFPGSFPRKRRWMIVNVWRPLSLVQNYPLALCDIRSVRRGDCIAADFVHRDYEGETFFLKAKHEFPTASKADCGGGVDDAATCAQEYKWHYLSEQQPDEVILFRIFDSTEWERDGLEAGGCPHASFSLGDDAALPARESVEVRCFVFFDEDTDSV